MPIAADEPRPRNEEARRRRTLLTIRPSSLRALGPLSSRRGLAIAAAALTALVLSACGSADRRETTGTYAGEDGAAAPYLNVGKLVYQVQISRSLNPWETEDADYLQGMPDDGKELQQGEEWFGVFIQVYNETKSAQPDASEITVYDIEGNTYHPLSPSGTNLYAYKAGEVPAKSQIPTPDSTASYGATGGALLIYKIKDESLENRPLKLKIVSPTDPAETATAELDV